MRIIDAHNHPDWHAHDFTKYLANMARYNIDKTWLLSWEAPITEYDPSYNTVSLVADKSSCSATGRTRAGPTPSTNWKLLWKSTASRYMAN